MEATQDLTTVFEQEEFTLDSYEALTKLALAGAEPLNRFLELLHGLEQNTTAGGSSRAVKLGVCYLLLSDCPTAVRWLEEAQSGALRSYFLGLAYLELARHADAAREFEQAAQLGWDNVECDSLKAECLILNGDYDRAAELLGDGPPSGESSTHWHYAKGRLCQATGELEPAIDHFEQALAKDGQHAKSLFHLAYLLDLHGDDEEAMELYSECAKLPVVYANALINLAVLHEDCGDYEEAAQCLRRVLAVNPNNPRANLFERDVTAACGMLIDEQEVRDQEKRNAVLDIPVTDFELSVRSRNCLKKMNIFSLGDLLKTTEPELLAYKNFGETSLREIKAMLTQKGLALGQLADQPASPQEPLETEAPTPTPQGNPEMAAKSVSSLELSVRSRKCLQRLGISTVGELIDRSESELLESKNFGQTSLVEIKTCLTELGIILRGSEEQAD